MTTPPEEMTGTPDKLEEGDMDALSDVLRVAHLTGGVFLHAEFFAPWCIASHLTPEQCQPVLGPVTHLILFHYVVEGGLNCASTAKARKSWRSGQAKSCCCRATTCT